MRGMPEQWRDAKWSPTGLAIMILKHLRAQYVARGFRPGVDDCTREINRLARKASAPD